MPDGSSQPAPKPAPTPQTAPKPNPAPQPAPKPAPTPSPVPAGNVPGTTDSGTIGDPYCHKVDDVTCQIELETHRELNRRRVAKGLKALKFSPRVAYAAREWSKAMHRTGQLSHKDFPTARTAFIASEFKSLAGLQLYGENVSYPYVKTGLRDPVEIANYINNRFEVSPEHNKIMYNDFSGIVGIGLYFVVIPNKYDDIWITQIYGDDKQAIEPP
jgi:uncharacterized protein YkwD